MKNLVQFINETNDVNHSSIVKTFKDLVLYCFSHLSSGSISTTEDDTNYITNELWNNIIKKYNIEKILLNTELIPLIGSEDKWMKIAKDFKKLDKGIAFYNSKKELVGCITYKLLFSVSKRNCFWFDKYADFNYIIDVNDESEYLNFLANDIGDGYDDFVNRIKKNNDICYFKVFDLK